ncbi:Adam 17-like protease [Plakobranchus ocellatus]|uniref:Adam 17-like protease n=1 Tax=Plakobranchus ocellatus TaxID=259542 RepID=A0AAV3Z6M6_9GAST|nr:Adam 17-like protease [Plakobranchus ocellatus]
MESDIGVLFTGLYVYILFLFPALSSGLRFYEILTPSDITVKILNGSSITTVVFYFINQKYVLKLSPDGGILHPEAIAKVVDENNLETEVTIGRNKIFSGTVEHDLSRRVTAVEVNGTWIIHILSPDDLISIEPLLWYDRNGDLNTMVAFQGWEYFRLEEGVLVKTVQCGGSERDTMVESSSERLCMTFPKSQWGSKQDEHLTDQSKANARPLFEHTFGEPEDLAKQRETDVDLEVKPANLSYGHNKNQSRKTLNLKAQHQERTSLRSLVLGLTSTKPYNRKRFRRSGTDGSEEATDCDVMVIVDYNLFRQLGADVQMTIATMIMVYKYSDEIFRRTKFRNNPSCGIVLTEFRIHTDYSSQETHYNADGQDFIEGIMLLAILRNSTNSSQFYYFCLVHLNCKRNLRPSVVGLSYPAGRNQWSSGVCGVYYEGGVTPSPSNVLLSVDADDMGINLIVKLYAIETRI